MRRLLTIAAVLGVLLAGASPAAGMTNPKPSAAAKAAVKAPGVKKKTAPAKGVKTRHHAKARHAKSAVKASPAKPVRHAK